MNDLANAVEATGIPVNTAIPTISGTPQVGQTLTASTGEWTNNPTSYAYQWWDYTKNIEITGATKSTHVFQAGRIGSQVTCHVTATNSSGPSVAAVSAPTAAITAAGGGCPKGSAYPDGCAGAPAGSPLYPTLLDGYGSHRPPWNVAGVEYHVGVPDGAVLADWRTISIPHVAVDRATGLVEISGDCVFDNIDFSLGVGAVLYNPPGGAKNVTVTVNNCYFKFPSPNGAYMINDANIANLTITNSTFDGSIPTGDGINSRNASFISAGGNVTIQYCWFKNNSEHILEWTSEATGMNIKMQFNFIDDTLTGCTCKHMNYQQLSSNGGMISSDTVTFNTTFQKTIGGGEGFQFYFNGHGTLQNALLENNTMIALPCAVNPNWCPNCVPPADQPFVVGPATVSNFIDAGKVGSGANKNNYFAGQYSKPQGAIGTFYPGTMTPAQGWASSGNIDMTTGEIITPA